MHVVVFDEFDKVLADSGLKPKQVLEVGTPPDKTDSLLFLPSIPKRAKRYGVDMAGPYEVGGVKVAAVNAHKLPYDDASFDLVLCNAVLEHDAQFWLTVGEMKRVLRPGGLLIIGVPGFADSREYSAGGGGTVTLSYHRFPEDYYRFSPTAVTSVFLADLEGIGQRTIMKPPRIIGWGKQPGGKKK